MPAPTIVRALCASSAILIGSLALEARAGTTFTDVTDALGINYERSRSAQYAYSQVFQWDSQLYPVDPQYIRFTPMSPHGLPGAVVFDHDGDGDLDVFVTNGPGASNALLVNQLVETGALGFVDDAVAAGVAATAMDGNGACYGDIDNDGDPDLLVLGRQQPNRLYENRGDGTFAAIASSGLGTDSRFHTSCAFGDVDGDGQLDVVVANAFESSSLVAIFDEPFSLNQHNQLYVNQGDGKFLDVSAIAGIEDTDMPVMGDAGITWAVSMVDVDLDGDTDIVFADDQGAIPTQKQDPINGVDRGFIHILTNDGAGNFVDVAQRSSPESPGAWMGLAFGDLNCDGAMDLFATNFGDYDYAALGMPYKLGDQSARQYLGDGAGGFDEIPSAGATAFGWGAAMFDADNDGDSDLVYHGGVEMTFIGMLDNPGIVLENEGVCGGSFITDTAPFDGRHLRRNARAVAIGDLDRDGFVDVVTAANWVAPKSLPLAPSPVAYGHTLDNTAFYVSLFQSAPNGKLVWRGIELERGDVMIELNDGNGNGSVTVRPMGTVGLLEGGAVNRSGIGAVVSFTPDGGPTAMMPITGGSSHASAHANEAYFGLGATPDGTVDVLWPGGVRNKLYSVHAGERLLLPEIPCSYDTGDSFQAYRVCVKKAVVGLQQAGLITLAESFRLQMSALIAYAEAHP